MFQRNNLLVQSIDWRGHWEGELLITMVTADQTITSSISQKITYLEIDEESGFMNLEMNAPTMITAVIALVMMMAIALIIRKKSFLLEEEDIEIQGPPITHGPPVSQPLTTIQQPDIEQQSTSPALPETGLPAGWSEEQWQHYGQEYLDRMAKQP